MVINWNCLIINMLFNIEKYSNHAVITDYVWKLRVKWYKYGLYNSDCYKCKNKLLFLIENKKNDLDMKIFDHF